MHMMVVMHVGLICAIAVLVAILPLITVTPICIARLLSSGSGQGKNHEDHAYKRQCRSDDITSKIEDLCIHSYQVLREMLDEVSVNLAFLFWKPCAD